MLATCSTYFRGLFVGRNVAGAGLSGSGCMAHPIVFIPDLSSDVMEHLLAFMYHGETTVTPEVLLPLIDAAKLLGIQGLMDPGNIRQLLEHNFEVAEGGEERGDHSKLGTQEEQEEQVGSAKVNGDHALNGKSVEEIISQELTEIVVPPPPELAAPDSSNNSVFPRTVFPSLSAIPAPLALSLAATSQLALGLDLSHRLGFQPGRRRKSSPPGSNEAKSPRLSSPANSGGSSNMINSSSAQPHYPPTEDPSRPFGCTQCPKRFRMKHHLKEHMLIHSGEMPFSCHLCPKRFNRSYTLKNHMKLHSAGTIVDKFQPA